MMKHIFFFLFCLGVAMCMQGSQQSAKIERDEDYSAMTDPLYVRFFMAIAKCCCGCCRERDEDRYDLGFPSEEVASRARGDSVVPVSDEDQK